MRQRKALKASTRTVCIFCAHRLSTTPPCNAAPSLQQARSFQSGPKQSQWGTLSAEAKKGSGAAAQPSSVQASQWGKSASAWGHQAPSSNPQSSLSAEDTARAALLARFTPKSPERHAPSSTESQQTGLSTEERARQALLARGPAQMQRKAKVETMDRVSNTARKQYRPPGLKIKYTAVGSATEPNKLDEAAKNWHHLRKSGQLQSVSRARDERQARRGVESTTDRSATGLYNSRSLNGPENLFGLGQTSGKPSLTSFLSPTRRAKTNAPNRVAEEKDTKPSWDTQQSKNTPTTWQPVGPPKPSQDLQAQSADTSNRSWETSKSPEQNRPSAQPLDSQDTDRFSRSRRSRRNEEIDENDDFRTTKSRSKRKAKGGRDQYDEGKDHEYYLKRESKQEKKANRKAAKKEQQKEQGIPIVLPAYITVANFAPALNVKVEALVEKMEELGFENVDYDYVLNTENASLVAMEYNFDPTFQEDEATLDLLPLAVPQDKSGLPARPPVVTIMGHVDHGKTTILDYMRKSAVVASEFGGITQHIGAFSVPRSSGKTITFLDTPGHSAFETMRKRGANVTDIVVLVVAADDSVKPQTIEAIKHAQNAQVPMIVAINKMDKEGADPDQVKRDLLGNGIEVEDYGGDVQAIEVSGKTGQGLDDLEEAIVTLSEILDHRAATDGQVEGWVLEGSTKRSGKTATVLVRRGTLRVGDILVAGTTWTRVRSLKNDNGATVESASPGDPVEVDGWRDQPVAGDEAISAPDEARATSVIEYRTEKVERESLAKDMEAINETRRLEAERKATEEEAAEAPSAAAAGGENALPVPREETSGVLTIPFIIKADVSGSAEAIIDSVSAIGNSDIRTQVLRSGVGPVSEFDIEHAAAAGGHVISFNLAMPPAMRGLAASKGVQLLEHNIIYRLSDNVKEMLAEKLPPRMVQRVLGEAEILKGFSINVKARTQMLIAGCKVRNGIVKRGGKVKVLRGGAVIHTGTISTLKNVKKDVDEMHKGTECGMSFEKWQDFQPGDHVQYYEENAQKRTL